ncbi:zinc finger CCCH domain-containing protein 3 isoform X1 [Neolamprologus brichardi]|uniref:zinc finger CCCH domain-containing protein 3 isoform X1 n=1 Tax=Neolamprologus brichardi TaxID=32507 RepID=UPI0003EC4B54|nr:zinc finger CCCH domain-containing protein 3 isoform X1 [Neolamprologus brichardi]
MEEREALKRQIELLQNLINKHKSTHGDTPFTGTEQSHTQSSVPARGRGQSASMIYPPSSRGRLYAPQSCGSWRKTYSLRNKNPESSAGHPSASASSTVHHSHSMSLPSLSTGSRTATISSETSQLKKKEHISSITESRDVATEKKNSDALGKMGSASEFTQRVDSRNTGLQGKKIGVSFEVASSATASTSAIQQSSSQVKIGPSLKSRTSTDSQQIVANTSQVTLTAGLSTALQQASSNSSLQSSKAQVNTSYSNKSKFTWVKGQSAAGAELKPLSSLSTPSAVVAPTSVLKSGVAIESPPSFVVAKRTAAKKLPRKLSQPTVAAKTSKYRWVSSAGAQAKTSRKPPSPKPLTLTQRSLDKGEATRKLKPGSSPSVKLKKGIAVSSAGTSQSSRYRWKAGGQSTSVAGTAGATANRRRSAFHWTAEKSNKGLKGGISVPLSLPQRTSMLSSSSPGGFKLRSRMKIIRRSTISGSGSEKVSPPAVKHSPQGRIYTLARTPTGVRRTPTRELVSFGRHKLRRLSPVSSKTNANSSSHRNPASQRVFRTRYKMVTHLGSSAMQTLYYNPALSWRAKRIQSARSFLQSRLRAPHDRHPSSTQQWRGSSMCWIRGSLYRVSANKLSRTVAANMSINRTGRSSCFQVSHMVPAMARPSSTRHLARYRAVQRSLAIIRHARQKQRQKQYCMYYNRFGKCNRGTSCPFIHDPDKVAVCTRFLRGTCKQADGTCPFSHKVAKEKMPVCSYFLKGICNNSDCPYSHVYVSRKAEVCQDFVKGYCPEGEKCKKKHTLVCPDFSKTGSCPHGSRCKLQHRQRVKRRASNSVTPPAKKARTKDPLKRPHLSVVMPQDSQASLGMPSAGSLVLPSFISLSSSPEEADAPDTLPTDAVQVKEKKLQIKPRL